MCNVKSINSFTTNLSCYAEKKNDKPLYFFQFITKTHVILNKHKYEESIVIYSGFRYIFTSCLVEIYPQMGGSYLRYCSMYIRIYCYIFVFLECSKSERDTNNFCFRTINNRDIFAGYLFLGISYLFGRFTLFHFY